MKVSGKHQGQVSSDAAHKKAGFGRLHAAIPMGAASLILFFAFFAFFASVFRFGLWLWLGF